MIVKLTESNLNDITNNHSRSFVKYMNKTTWYTKTISMYNFLLSTLQIHPSTTANMSLVDVQSTKTQTKKRNTHSLNCLKSVPHCSRCLNPIIPTQITHKNERNKSAAKRSANTPNKTQMVSPLQYIPTTKKRRKKASIRERDRLSTKNDTKTDEHDHPKEDKPPQKFKMKKRKLMIVFRNDDNQISKQIQCKYRSHMSKEEIDRERARKQHKRKKRNKRIRMDITRQYKAAINRLNNPQKQLKHHKRPSIIMMYTPTSPHNCNDDESGNHSPISLMQSESETVTGSSEYVVPHEIIKGYTECFFGYGKYLCQNKRVKEGVHNLLECASWYDDSFVDPSCLTSLVLPPQFLFQDSVKKRHCINFRTLTKYISRILGEEQRHLDKRFKQMNMQTKIKEYEQYLEAYQDEIQEHLKIVVNASDPDDTHSISPAGSTSSNQSNGGVADALEGFTLGPAHLQLDSLNLENAEILSEASLSPGLSPMESPMLSPLLSPMLSPNVSNSFASHGVHDHEHKHKNVINYEVYPQDVQDLVTQYEDLCGNYQRLGLLLTDFLRYSDAKREFNRALVIFRKLKIKSPLYESLVSEIRNAQNQSVNTPSGRERAQYLAKKHQTPSSRSNVRAPISPSFDFSFSDHFATAALHHADRCAVH
eukprot:1121885_1